MGNKRIKEIVVSLKGEEMTCSGLNMCKKNISEPHYNHVCLSDNYCDDWEHSGDALNIPLHPPCVWRNYYEVVKEIRGSLGKVKNDD